MKRYKDLLEKHDKPPNPFTEKTRFEDLKKSIKSRLPYYNPQAFLMCVSGLDTNIYNL